MSKNQYDVESDDNEVIILDSGDKSNTEMEIESPSDPELINSESSYYVEKSTEYFIQIIEQPDYLFEAVELNLWLINEVTFKNIKPYLDQRYKVIIIFYDSYLKTFRGYAKVVDVFKTEEIISHIYADIEWLGFGDVELKNLDNTVIIEGRLLNGMKIYETEGSVIIKEIDKNLENQPQCFQKSFTNPTFYNNTCQTLLRCKSFSEYNTNRTNIRVLQRSLSNVDRINKNSENSIEFNDLSLPLLPPYDTMNYPPPFTYQYIRYSSYVGRMKNNKNKNIQIEKPMIFKEHHHHKSTTVVNEKNKKSKEKTAKEASKETTTTETQLLLTTTTTVTIATNDINTSPSDNTESESKDFLDDLLDHDDDSEFE